MKLETLLAASVPVGSVTVFLAVAAAVPLLLEGSTLSVPRAGHQASLLQDGRVLITGGCAGPGCSEIQRSAEMYDPRTRRFSTVASMRVARVSHTATALPQGRVLVAGGWTGSAATATTEIYDPAAGLFTPGPGMSVARMDGTATQLDSGDVLLVGGATRTNQPTAVVDRFSPKTGELAVTGALNIARVHHSAVRLQDGRVLVAGGLVGRNSISTTAEIYDPATGTFKSSGSLMQPRCKHAALLLRDGRVMVLGGSMDCDDRQKLATTEIYDPANGTFAPGPRLNDPRYKISSAAVTLESGAVIIAGDSRDVEVWLPGSSSFTRVAGNLGSGLAFSSATTLRDGQVLVAGGYDRTITPTARTWQVSVPARAAPKEAR
jgi:hypothetical protein